MVRAIGVGESASAPAANRSLRLAIAATVAIIPATATANPMEILGLTSRHAAQANAGVASVDDAAALYYNPAGLVLDPQLELAFGTVAAYSHLAIGDAHPALTDPFAVQLAMRAPLPLRGPWGKRVVIGVALHLLPHNVARVISPAPDQPFYPFYDDRMSRVVVLPGIAVRASDSLVIGVAVNVLAGLAGTISATEGATRAIDARVDERVPTVARVIAGAMWQVSPAIRLGGVYRQRFEIPFATTAHTLVAGEPIDLDLRAAGEFTPNEFVAGVAWSPAPLVASLDVGWSLWSGYPGPYVQVDSELPLIGPVPGQAPTVPFKDTIAIRLGLESRRTGDGWIVRGGYAFETSPVPATQSGVSNLLDGPHHTIGLGLGYSWGTIRLDAHVQAQLVGSRTLQKKLWDGTGTYDPFTSLRDEDTDTPGTQITNPGYPSLASGGQVLSAGLTLDVTR